MTESASQNVSSLLSGIRAIISTNLKRLTEKSEAEDLAIPADGLLDIAHTYADMVN
jgi:hypothetical protein